MNIAGASRNKAFVQAIGENSAPTPTTTVVTTISRINLDNLWVEEKYQVSRVCVGGLFYDPDWASQFATMLTEDPEKELDPVDVFNLHGRPVLVHGYNRFGAYQMAGRTSIPAIVYEGDEAAAMAFALRANARPSKPQSVEDKEKRVRMALDHYGMNRPSREIARLLDGAVSHPFVSKVKAKIEAEALTVAQIVAEQTGAPVLAQTAPQPILATRKGTTYEMKAPVRKSNVSNGKVATVQSVPVQPVRMAPVLASVICTVNLTAEQVMFLRQLLAANDADLALGIKAQLVDLVS